MRLCAMLRASRPRVRPAVLSHVLHIGLRANGVSVQRVADLMAFKIALLAVSAFRLMGKLCLVLQ